MNLIGCNDMLAVFVAGAVSAWDDWIKQRNHNYNQLWIQSSIQPFL